jgi:hypothetical protein
MKYLVDQDMAGERGAVISDCEEYRQRLWMEWDRTKPTMAVLMLNPSRATHLVDDPTWTRCLGRAVAGKFGRLEIANLFPLRATDPSALLTHPDPLGPERTADGAVMDAVERASMIICAWGAHPMAPARAAHLMHIFGIVGWRNRLYHLGLNKDGSPKHPLYIAASTRPKPFIFEASTA